MVGLGLPKILMLHSLANEEKQVAILPIIGKASSEESGRGTMGILALGDSTVYIV